MKHTIKEIASCKIEVTTEVEKEVWKEAQEKGFKKASANVSIKGFRPGKAPEAMLRAHVDGRKVMDEAINEAIQLAFNDILITEKVKPMYRPNVDIVKVDDDALTLKFVIVTIPEVKLGEYKGLSAKKEAPSVKDSEIDEAIKNLLSRNAELTVVEREAKIGDTVVLDFEGFIGDKAFDGGKGDNYALELGSKSFVPGFEDQLVGTKAGDKKDVVVTFPTQYVAELAGKEATFKCVVHEVKEKKIPELNDESVKDLNIKGVETVEALKNHEKESILTNKVNEASRAFYDAIVKQIVANSDVKIADEIIDAEVSANLEETKKKVEQQGLTFEQYLNITGKKEEDLKKEIAVSSKANLTAYLCLEQIAIAEKITVTDEDVKFEFAKMAEQYGMKAEEVENILKPQIDNFKSQLRSKKIQDFIVANSKEGTAEASPKAKAAPKKKAAEAK